MAEQKCSYPEFAAEAPVISQNNFKVRVAIDFGTDGVALAYAFGETNNVTAHAAWSGKRYQPTFKPKTIILLDENYEFLAFDKDAKHMYDTAARARQQRWFLFERFKMALYDGEPDTSQNNDDEKKNNQNDVAEIAIRDELTAANGQKVRASVVFIAAFRYLRDQVQTYLRNNSLTRRLLRNLQDSEYQWIITVPAIWNDEAKYRMRQWSIDAGLVNAEIEDQCIIVYEPDCASLAVQYEINRCEAQISNPTDDAVDDAKDDNKQNDIEPAIGFKKGEKYILVDAGGGTVDIACHEILGENGEYGVKEILHPSGGPWGSCYIDDQFVILLKNIFGDEWIEEFKTNQPRAYLELLDNFQFSKSTFYDNQNSDKHAVRIPFDFMGFIEDKLDDENGSEQIAEIVSSSTVFEQQNLVSLSDDYLAISKVAWKIMFDHVMNPTINHIKTLLMEPKLMRKCKYLCLVGGLSTSSYFQTRMRNEFGAQSPYRLVLIIPRRPILSVVEGAAYFAITPNYIKARVLKYTYGEVLSIIETQARNEGVPTTHIDQYRVYNEYKQKWYVKNCFTVIARKNEEIYTGQIKKSFGDRSTPQQMQTKVTIMVSSQEDPKVMSDGTILGGVTIAYDNEDEDDMSATLEFHFYSTVIKAVAYRNKAPNDKKICYITNYK